MLPTSHHAPMNLPASAVKSPLADAFTAFMATADRMEASYSQLQGEVVRLRRELEERNAALTQSLAENKSIRTALKRILDALPCGVIVIDDNDSIVLVNPEAGRLLGTSSDAALLLTHFPAHIQLLLKAAVSRDDEHEVTVELEKATRWLSIRRTALHVDPSVESLIGPDQNIVILRDITARKEAELQRESSRNMLALGEMAAVLAHEIRNPLGSMELWTSVLEKQSRDWRRREILRRASAGRHTFAISDGQQCFAVPWPRISQSHSHTAERRLTKRDCLHPSAGRAG